MVRTISPGPRTPIRDQPGLISVPDLHSPYRALGKTPKWDFAPSAAQPAYFTQSTLSARAGFGFTNLTTVAFPEIDTAITHLREVLGDQTDESSPAKAKK